MKLLSRLMKQTRAPTEPIPDGSDSSLPTFEALLPKTPELRSQFIEYVKIVNNSGGLYHQLDFGNGLVTNGWCNMAKFIRFYDLPTSLEGKTILDVGTSSRYFALECARGGCKVTAIDIFNNKFLEVFLSLVNVNIKYMKKSIYELDSEFCQFDIVMCGSLLLHFSDPFGTLRKI